jgi:hypothetical protein
MPCLLVILALFVPRVVVLALWFFSDWFLGMFDTILWPVLGLLFLPTSLLWFSVVQNWYGGVWSIVPVIGIVAALLIDISPTGAAPRR